jgi:hypothetical protein
VRIEIYSAVREGCAQPLLEYPIGSLIMAAKEHQMPGAALSEKASLAQTFGYLDPDVIIPRCVFERLAWTQQQRAVDGKPQGFDIQI